MKSASRQFAHGHDITAIHRRPGVRRRVFDLIAVSCVEMLHRYLRLSMPSIASSVDRRPADSTFCCAAQFYAAMHKPQAGVRALTIAPAFADTLAVLHPFLLLTARSCGEAKQFQAKPNKSKQNSLDFLGFIRPNQDFSMGYTDSKQKSDLVSNYVQNVSEGFPLFSEASKMRRRASPRLRRRSLIRGSAVPVSDAFRDRNTLYG
jgi:hypothetical protein